MIAALKNGLGVEAALIEDFKSLSFSEIFSRSQ